MKTQQVKQQADAPFQAQAKNQGAQSSILQTYKNKTAQRQSTDEEELLQGKFEPIQLASEEEELLQGKFETVQRMGIDEEEPVQGKFETTQLATEEEEPLQRQPNNTGLPDNLKSGIENMSGYSMDNVKVHYNSSQPATLQAHAYAQGTDIHVAPGQEKHVPHEAWHVVQQKQGRVKPTMQMKGTVPVNDDAGLEKEADVMGAKALSQISNTKPLQNKRSHIMSGTKLPVQRVLTRSMWKIINETEFKDGNDKKYTKLWLYSKYGERIAEAIIEAIEQKQTISSSAITVEESEMDEKDEVSINWIDHGDLNEYDNPEAIDNYITTNGVAQLARKGNTESGPKNYTTNNVGSFKNVSYKTDGKGCIDFSSPFKKTTWSDPVLAGSEINLSAANKTIDTKNRAQHFAIGDFLYAKKLGKSTASYTTGFRKGKWTWHHLPTAYKMVLVDMTAHAKHGHNGGVYLW